MRAERTLGVTAIKARWQRVKVTDTVATNPASPTRMGRDRVIQLTITASYEETPGS